MDKDKKDVKIEIKLDEALATGVFSNFANISHSPDEFVIDFLFVNPTPHPGFGKLVSRVILTPGHAKRILMALNDNIRKYEENLGEIKASTQPDKIRRNLQ